MELNSFKQEILSLANPMYLYDVGYEIKTNNYSFGDSSKWVYNRFSLKKALDTIGAKEVTIEDLQRFNIKHDPYLTHWTDGFMGLSTMRRVVGVKEFAINPDSKYWQAVVLHECGHMFLEKGNSEADYFSYFCLKELKMRKENIVPLATRIMTREGLYDTEILDIQRKAKEFIALGRS